MWGINVLKLEAFKAYWSLSWHFWHFWCAQLLGHFCSLSQEMDIFQDIFHHFRILESKIWKKNFSYKRKWDRLTTNVFYSQNFFHVIPTSSHLFDNFALNNVVKLPNKIANLYIALKFLILNKHPPIKGASKIFWMNFWKLNHSEPKDNTCTWLSFMTIGQDFWLTCYNVYFILNNLGKHAKSRLIWATFFVIHS